MANLGVGPKGGVKLNASFWGGSLPKALIKLELRSYIQTPEKQANK